MEKGNIFIQKVLYFQEPGKMMLKLMDSWCCLMEMCLKEILRTMKGTMEFISIKMVIFIKVTGKMT